MSRCNSAEPPELAATEGWRRSALAKQQSTEQYWPGDVQSSFCATVPTSVSQQQTGTQADAAADAALAASFCQPASNVSPGAFHIRAAKPSLLAQIQAVGQQESSSGADVQTELVAQNRNLPNALHLTHTEGEHALHFEISQASVLRCAIQGSSHAKPVAIKYCTFAVPAI